MHVRRSSIVLAVVGIVLIVSAVLLRIVVVPIASKLPGNTNLGVKYAGTATMLNSTALESGDTKNVIASGLPVTVDRRVKVTGTHGDTAILTDTLTISAGGQTLPSAHTYALDRASLAGATPPKGLTVEPSKGALSSAFPLGPKADNSYRYYDSTTQTIVPIGYTGDDTRGGREVNVYEIAATGPIKDPGLLAMFPAVLAKSLLATLAPALPADVLAKVTPATLAALPDPVPLSYTGTTNIVAYVDRQTGVAIDQTISQQVLVNVMSGEQSLSLIPVLALDFHISPDSVKYLADKAGSAGRLLTIMKVIVPITFVVIGVLLVVIAVIRRKKPTRPGPASSPSNVDGSRATSQA